MILGLLFLGTTINYLDRTVISILAPDLQKLFHISDSGYGDIQSAFAICYAAGQLVAGGLIDRVGIRMGYGLALVCWSISSMLHVIPRSAAGFIIMRGLLGFSESPNFPAATKALAEWFPRRERSLAFGFINAGTNMGAILAPIMVPWLAINYGWQWAFVVTGGIGFAWLLLWIPLYRPPAAHPRVSREELAYIQSDPIEHSAKVPWLSLLTYRQAWAFALGKFLTDSMWWFFMSWAPKFLNKEHGLELVKMGPPLVVIYLMADVGSVTGGWLSSAMLKAGFTVNRARKTALFLCALGVIPVIFIQNVHSLWPAVLILGLATASHQGFSSNLYTLVSDMFPRQTVASVAGFGGTCGFLGASIFQSFVGRWVEARKDYFVPFLCAGSAYVIAFVIMQILAPKLQPASFLQSEER